MLLYRLTWTATTAAVALLGLAVTVGSVALSEPALATALLVIALVLARVHTLSATGGTPTPPEMAIAAGIGLGGLALFGLLELLGPVAWALIGVVAATAVPLLLRQPGRAVEVRQPGCDDPRGVGRADALSTDELCRAWRLSHAELASSSGAQRAELVRVRQRYLDALERHDPDGVARWLATTPGPDSDPRPFLTHPAGHGSRRDQRPDATA
jgi:hypothetical protein